MERAASECSLAPVHALRSARLVGAPLGSSTYELPHICYRAAVGRLLRLAAVASLLTIWTMQAPWVGGSHEDETATMLAAATTRGGGSDSQRQRVLADSRRHDNICARVCKLTSRAERVRVRRRERASARSLPVASDDSFSTWQLSWQGCMKAVVQSSGTAGPVTV